MRRPGLWVAQLFTTKKYGGEFCSEKFSQSQCQIPEE